MSLKQFLKQRISAQLFGAFLLGAASVSQAQTHIGPAFPMQVGEWILFGGHPLNYLMYGAITSLRRDGGIVSVWVMRTTYGNPRPGLILSGGLSSKTYENIDCYEKRIRFEHKITYPEIMGGGQPISTSSQPIHWQVVVPSTDGSIMYNFFCDPARAWWK